MQKMPLAQCYIYTVVIGFWLLLILIGKPFKSKAAHIILVFHDSVKLILGIIAIVLATNDVNYFINSDMMLIVGYVLISVFGATIGINTLLSIGFIFYSIYHLYKKWRNRSKKRSKRKKELRRRGQHRVTNDSRISLNVHPTN